MKILLTAFAAAILTTCGGSPTAKKEILRPAMTGAFSAERKPTAEETALFRQLTDTLRDGKYTPEKVATQIVAGMNYRFICRVRETSGERKRYRAEVVVFQPLPGQGEARITRIRPL